MSSVEALAPPVVAAPAPTVELPSTQPPHREPLPRRRLDLIYFALAGFDLLTIAFTLMLSNHIMGLYEQSVARSAIWSARVGHLVQLAQYAQETNAPGNDIFDSHNVALERARRDRSLADYRRQRDAILLELDDGSVTGESAVPIGDDIREADRHMADMMREADNIFDEIAAGDEDAAGRRMATMDRVYARLSRSLMAAIMEVQRVEDANLSRQVGLATELRRLEFVVMGLIFAIVIFVAFYGRRIGIIMRKTEDAHNEMLTELEAANQGLEQYADNVAHELRNPVNKVLLASEVALSRPRGTEEYQDTLVSIVEECRRLSGIVGSLLFLARARRTKIDLELQRIDAGVELDVIRTYFETSAQEAGLRLGVSCYGSLGFNVDRTLFQRAVSNLVANALAHTPRGGRIHIEAVGHDDRIVVSVADTGEGVSPEAQVRVFDRFFRVDTVRSSSSGRIGLGLPITKSIMDLHGGAVAMRSLPGEGTTVTLTFPR